MNSRKSNSGMEMSIRTMVVLGFAFQVSGVGFMFVIQIRGSLRQSRTKFPAFVCFEFVFCLSKVLCLTLMDALPSCVHCKQGQGIEVLGFVVCEFCSPLTYC